MTRRSHRRSVRHAARGMTVLESVLAIALLAAATAGVVELAATTARWNRRTWQTQLLGEQLADLAERTAAAPWDALSPEELAKTPLSAITAREFPAATLAADVDEEESGGRRITLRLRPAPDAPEARLTLWRFAPEAAP